MTFNTRTTYTQKPVRLAIRLWSAADQFTMSYHDIENTGTYN